MGLSFSEQQNALSALFSEWHGSADRDDESERLSRISIENIEEYRLMVKKDLLDSLDPLDMDNIVNMLELIVIGKNKYTIKEHFEGMLVAARRPVDEKYFAREILNALNKNKDNRS